MKYFLSILILASLWACKKKDADTIVRMGNQDFKLFNTNWLFTDRDVRSDKSTAIDPGELYHYALVDSLWLSVDLPHPKTFSDSTIISDQNDIDKWKGITWYRKHFRLTYEDIGGYYFLHFEGKPTQAHVWCNGKFIGTWTSGDSSFYKEITPYLYFNNNDVIAVQVISENGDTQDGLNCKAWLVHTNHLFVRHGGTHITTPVITDHRIEVKIETKIVNTTNDSLNISLLSEIYKITMNKISTPLLTKGSETIMRINAHDTTCVVETVGFNPTTSKDFNLQDQFLIKSTVKYFGITSDIFYSPLEIKKSKEE